MGINWADADCHYGDHFYRKPNGVVCTNCYQTNWQLLSYYGYRARMAKKAGITVEDWDKRQEALAEASAEEYDKAMNGGTGAALLTTPAKSGERTAPATTADARSPVRCTECSGGAEVAEHDPSCRLRLPDARLEVGDG